MDRRKFLKVARATAVVVGFDSVRRAWVTDVRAAGPFDGVPALDGQLLLDRPSRQSVATDQGNILRQLPTAVLLPGSVADISRIILAPGPGIFT